MILMGTVRNSEKKIPSDNVFSQSHSCTFQFLRIPMLITTYLFKTSRIEVQISVRVNHPIPYFIKDAPEDLHCAHLYTELILSSCSGSLSQPHSFWSTSKP